MPNPVLPAETVFGDIELDLYENEPQRLFPENQDSYWGQVRKVFADHLQLNLANAFEKWYQSLDPRLAAVDELHEWEERLGIPVNEAKDPAARRAAIITRLSRGAFTTARANQIIEDYLAPTIGVAPAFTEEGIPITVGGITLLADPVALTTLYRFYQDVMNHTFEVWIKNTVTPDMAGLTRELQRIRPAGFAMTFDNTKANILDYFRTIITDGPTAYLRGDGNANDSGGLALNGTGAGGVLFNGAALAQNAGGNAFVFDGIDDVVSITDTLALNPRWSLSVEAWAFPTTISGVQRGVVRKGNSYALQLDTTNKWSFTVWVGGTPYAAISDAVAVVNTTYHLLGIFDGKTVKLYVNGVLQTIQPAIVGQVDVVTSVLTIGAATTTTLFFVGRLDEVALYGYPLSSTQDLKHYNTGINVS